MLYQKITDLIGNTPIIKFNTNEVNSNTNIYVKMEGFNPTGSVKDRAGLYNILGAIDKHELKSGMTILDASSGNMACAIAFLGKVFGYDTELVCSKKITEDKKRFIEYFGAKLTVYGDFTIEANRYCSDVLLRKNSNKYCFLDQLHNDSNPKASYETLGPEILRDVPQIKMLVGSLGSGGSMLGATEFLKENLDEMMAVTVESSSGYRIPGTGTFIDGDYITPFIERGRECVFDSSVAIDLPNAKKRTYELAEQGIFVGWQTGGVLDATISSIKKFNLEGDVVMISGDSAWKSFDKIMPKTND
jgi:cysteine synthase